jgi:DNA-binding NarL/FixJ family response regulator
MMAPVRVIVADDAPLWREAVRVVTRAGGLDLVAEVGDAEALLAAVAEHVPDLVIVDVRMPPTGTDDGLRAAFEIRRRHPGIAVLVLSQYVHIGPAVDLLSTGRAGVGYLLKDRVAGAGELISAIREVAAGGSRIDPLIAERMIARRRDGDPIDELTAREREVLALMAEGAGNGTIAERLFITVRTVEAHVRAILRKLGLLGTVEENRRVLAVLTWLRAQAER